MKSFFSSFVVNWLKYMAKLQLMKVQPTVIGVTGSSGKSSCVQAIGIVLSEKYKTKVGRKGNSETGIPMEILGIEVGTYNGIEWLHVCVLAIWKVLTNWEQYEYLVLEMGIDSEKAPKNMSHLLSIVKPHIGVFLSVTSVHGQNFSGSDILQSISNEKGKILTELNEDDIAIFSVDYPQIVKLETKIRAKKLTFSSGKKSATFNLLYHTVDPTETVFEFSHQNKKYSLHLPKQFHFKEAFGTFASAVLVGQELDISIEDACLSLSQHFQQPPGRMSIIEGIHDSIIIDSSYNSSLGPTSAALHMLKNIPGRKIAVLGDMRELGTNAQHDHEELAKVAKDSADIIVLVGPITAQYVLPTLKKLNFPEKNLYSFANAYEAIDTLKEIVKEDDLMLVKGSQNTIFLEIIVKALMKHPEQAEELLARQTPYWESQRQKIKNK